MNNLINCLLEGPPWVQYRTQLDLLDESEDNPQVTVARNAMLAHPQIQNLLTELIQWPGLALKRHNDVKHPLHKLTFIADLGFKISDAGVDQIAECILAHRISILYRYNSGILSFRVNI